MRVSKHFVGKVIASYDETNSGLKVPRNSSSYPTPKIDLQTLEFMEIEKTIKPSIYASEIRQRLLLDGVVPRENLPSKSQINRRLHNSLQMTKKRVSVIPEESVTPDNVQKQNQFLERISMINPNKIHFFDESSVVKTTGNRVYGNSTRGKPAYELQRYASNATYTINLLHSSQGVDTFNVLEGPSNGLELLNFFDDAIQIERGNGSAILERDFVIMDNCGFHHANFVEPVLREMLNDCGVGLIFQPPYCPHLNTCEYCFNQLKAYLKRNDLLTLHETKIAIGYGISEITEQNSLAYFKHVGYIHD